MKAKNSLLDTIQIPNPCLVGWDHMTGNDKVRYCGTCRKSVYNLSNMTQTQAENLVAASRGELCIQFVRLPDGAIATQSPIAAATASGARPSPVAAAVVTAMLGLGASTTAWPAPLGARTSPPYSVSPSQPREKAVPAGGSTSSLSGIIRAVDGDPIAEAWVKLTSLDTGATLSTSSNANGFYHFESPGEGSYSMDVSADGCESRSFDGIELVSGRDHQTNVILKKGETYHLAGAMVLPPLPLRTLYEDSPLIVVGIPTKSITVSRDEYSYSVKTKVSISQTVKGKVQRGSISVYHQEVADERDRFADGAPLLLFLGHDPTQGTFKARSYVPSHAGFGVKKLPDADLTSYLAHIGSLQTILQKTSPCNSDLAEWLVELAEDPATRDEAANDLSWGTHDFLFDTCDGDQPTAAAVTPTPMPPAAAEASGAEPTSAGPSCALVATADLLTSAQKERLINIVLGLEKISPGDLSLIRLVCGWGDNRLAPFLISRLEQMKSDPPEPTAISLIEDLDDLVDGLHASESITAYREAIEALTAPEASESSETEESQTSSLGDPTTSAAIQAVAKQRLGDLVRHVISEAKAALSRQNSPDGQPSTK